MIRPQPAAEDCVLTDQKQNRLGVLLHGAMPSFIPRARGG